MRKKTKIVLKIEVLEKEKEALERVIMDTAIQITNIDCQIAMLQDLRTKRQIKENPDKFIDDNIDIDKEKKEADRIGD